MNDKNELFEVVDETVQPPKLVKWRVWISIIFVILGMAGLYYFVNAGAAWSVLFIVWGSRITWV